MLPVLLGYDEHGRLASSTQGARTHLFAYDPATGYLRGVTDPMSQTVLYDRDPVDRTPRQALSSYQAGSLLGVQYTRDALGRILSKQETVEGVTHLHEYAYDLRGRLVEEKKDGGAVGQWVYDGNGNRVADTVAGRTGTHVGRR